MMRNFYSIPIEGVGTADIESLPSYAARLAHVHTVSLSTLLQTAINRHEGRYKLRRSIPHFLTPAKFVQPMLQTTYLVDALAFMCREPVLSFQRMTFQALRGILNIQSRAFSQELRWCPLCLAEQDARCLPAYFKLQWQLLAISHCANHRVELRQSCPHCKYTQRVFYGRTALERCSHCRLPLAKEKVEIVERSQLRADAMLLDLVEHIAKQPGAQFPTGGFSDAIAAIYDMARSRGQEAALLKHVDRDRFLRHVYRPVRTDISTALSLSRELGINLVDLLYGDVEGTNLPLALL